MLHLLPGSQDEGQGCREVGKDELCVFTWVYESDFYIFTCYLKPEFGLQSFLEDTRALIALAVSSARRLVAMCAKPELNFSPLLYFSIMLAKPCQSFTPAESWS